MSDRELDRLVAATAAWDDRDLATLPLDDAEAELCEEIMTSHPLPFTVPPAARRWVPRRWIAAAAAAAVLAAAVVGVQTLGSRNGTVWAAEVLAVAEAAPRLLVTAPGWQVTRADEFSAEVGEMTFSDGGRALDLHWRPAAQHASYVDDRAHGSDPPGTMTVAGQQAVLFRYTGTTDFTALWLDGGHSVELRGEFADEAAYRAVAATIERVGIDEWLSAMPASVVRPDVRAGVVDEMLADVPVPAGFDSGPLAEGASVSDRYQLGARVAGAAACAWIDQWLAAREAGDPAAEAEALAAMSSSRGWAILVEMSSQGGFSEVLWELVDAMEAGGVAASGFSVAGYEAALGCDAIGG